MEKEKNITKYNISLLGDHSVGKTCFFTKLSRNLFGPTIDTCGIDKVTLKFNDVEINIGGNIVKQSFNIGLFDTAGQERYRSITMNHILGADGIILIYDITKKESFIHVEYWLKSIKEILSDWKNSDYVIMLLGNKLDLDKEEEQEERTVQNEEDEREKRAVQTEEGKTLCDNQGIYWGGECSAKNDTRKQLLDIFENFVKTIYTKIGNKSKVKGEKIDEKIIKKKKKKCC